MLDGIFTEETPRGLPRAEPKPLRPHQILGGDMLRRSFKAGHRKTVVSMPTGAGKTIFAADLALKSLERGRRVAFLAPAISLVDQTFRAMLSQGVPYSQMGVMQADHPHTAPDKPIQVCSEATISARGAELEADLFFVDECHIQHSVVTGLMERNPNAYFVGLSATPWAKGMGLAWGDLVQPISMAQLIEQGRLSSYEPFAPDIPDLSAVKTDQGDYVSRQLAEIMGDAKILGNIVNNWLERGQNLPTLCFCVNRTHAAQVMERFHAHGVSCGYVDYFTSREERLELFEQYKHGVIRIICGVRTMTTGIDLPVGCLILAAPTKSYILHVQTGGRGLRVNGETDYLPDTSGCQIFDHAGNLLRLGFYEDITFDGLDKTPKGKRQESNPSSEPVERPCNSCGAVFQGKLCPSCGTERKPPRMTEADGDLVKIKKGKKKKGPTLEDKAMFWGKVLYYQVEVLKRDLDLARKATYALYMTKYKGEKPQGFDQRKMIMTTPDVLNYIKSRNIAYAKSKARRG